MIQIGKYQELEISRRTDNGLYLREPGTESPEVLLPNRYIADEHTVGGTVKVFVYKDSEDRPVATTEHPFVTVGEFAFLEVSGVNAVGAFLDWGLPKDILCPYSEQKVKMRRGGIYLVYVYLDSATGRVVASSRIEKFLGNAFPDYRVGQQVQALVYEHTEIGYRVIVDNLHRGMIYSNELYSPIELEMTLPAYVKQVREDGKIDLSVNPPARQRTETLAVKIIDYLSHGGKTPVGDKSAPELINQLFSCSKKDFKQAVGHLYKDKKIVITPEGFIKLNR